MPQDPMLRNQVKEASWSSIASAPPLHHSPDLLNLWSTPESSGTLVKNANCLLGQVSWPSILLFRRAPAPMDCCSGSATSRLGSLGQITSPFWASMSCCGLQGHPYSKAEERVIAHLPTGQGATDADGSSCWAAWVGRTNSALLSSRNLISAGVSAGTIAAAGWVPPARPWLSCETQPWGISCWGWWGGVFTLIASSQAFKVGLPSDLSRNILLKTNHMLSVTCDILQRCLNCGISNGLHEHLLYSRLTEFQ